MAIPIEVSSGAITGDAVPVTFGVPFAPGVHSMETPLVLVQRAGADASFPVQIAPQSVWPDGTVRWATVDVQVPAPKDGQSQVWFLARGVATMDGPRVHAEMTDAGAVVDTGALRFTVPRNRFAVLDDVHFRGESLGLGPLGSLMSIESRNFAAEPPTSVRIVEPGPLRARVEIRGAYGAEFHYVIRIDAFAGLPHVRIFHSFEHRGARTYASVRQIALDMPLPEGNDWVFRAGREDAEPVTGKVGETPVVIYQEDHEILSIDGVEQEGRTAGWVATHDGRRGVVMAGRFVWQEFPKSFHVESRRLRYNLWAPEARPTAIGMGAAKTHELVVVFHGAEAPDAATLDALAEPAVGRVLPEWLVATGALRNSVRSQPSTESFLARLEEAFAGYRNTIDRETWDAWGALNCTEVAGERPQQGYYGMLNWGDWNFPWYRDVVNGCETWGNLEYDLTQVLALGFAATGDREMFRFMTAAARHFMDVDRIHTRHADCDCYGMTHPRVARHFSFELGWPDLGFAWVEGLISYAFMTGDDRAMDAVREIADFLVRRFPREPVGLKPRQFGWPLVALVAAYEATGDARYKRAVRHYARHAILAFPPTSGRDPGVGTLADGVAYAHELLGNSSLERWLRAHAVAVMSAPPGVADPRYFPVVAYVARLDENEAYREAAADAVQRHAFGTWGKPFTLAGRGGFRILSLLP